MFSRGTPIAFIFSSLLMETKRQPVGCIGHYKRALIQLLIELNVSIFEHWLLHDVWVAILLIFPI